ncbi:MAG: Fe-S cluster assembly protein SufB, partial [Candidatus Micrarchaeota archaeon]|nr:Fe-S cluster assembly protein SufB [Candidatus Micrarchaeota archaeon]
YNQPNSGRAASWDDVPRDIRKVYEKMGLPEAEKRALLGGTVAQYQSESVYEKVREEWERKGVIFSSLDEAVKKHPHIVKKYFAKAVPVTDNKFSMLHYAVWSGGSFLYVPRGVTVSVPMQAYFFMREKREGQFEHTIIIAEEGASIHYIEGCSAPIYDKNSLHSAVVEVYAKDRSHVRYSTVQNWSKNVYNLNTKRAIVGREALMEWVSGSLGAKISMIYPSSILAGEGGRATHLAITVAGNGTIKEGGAKVIHAAPNTHSTILSKGICIGNGHGVYRGLVRIEKGAVRSTSSAKCDSLLIGRSARSDTFPYSDIKEAEKTSYVHEASAGRISEEQLSYLESRGIKRQDGMMLYVSGFISPVIAEIPLEYAIELNRFIQVEMEDSVC